jgi:hypothetical protein
VDHVFLQIQFEALPQLVQFVRFKFICSEVLPQLVLQSVGVSFLLVLSVQVLDFLLHFQSQSHQRPEVLDSTFVWVTFQALICIPEQRTEKVSCQLSCFGFGFRLIAEQQNDALGS